MINTEISTSWHSYPKIYNLGHAAIADLLEGEVVIEEKVDGSQFSFGKFNGEIKIRSKGKQMEVSHPEKMFNIAVMKVIERTLGLVEGWTYRGEYLNKPKHNALAYDRIPVNNIIIFDINTGEEKYLDYHDKWQHARSLGFETVPRLDCNPKSPEDLMKLLDITSILGGQKIEGFVIKNYSKFGHDKKVLMGKHVSESFKEVHKGSWRVANPLSGDILEMIKMQHRTPARWNKAIQHLRERGELTDSPKDIGLLLKEIQIDTRAECLDEIKATLIKWAWPHISRGITKGFPEYYKEELLKKQFDRDEVEDD